MKSMKKQFISAACLLLAGLGSATQAQAAACGSGGRSGTAQSTFYTQFATGGNNSDDCIGVPATNRGSASWNLSDSNRTGDFVGGVGWARGWNTGNLFYAIDNNTWSVSGSADGWVWFGAYGWSCGAGGGDQEYYIVQSYNAAPRQGTPLGSYTDSTGTTYDAYFVGGLNRAKFCGNGNGPFTQYWAIRRGSAGYGWYTIDLSAAMNFWSANNRGFNRNGVGNGYQVIGPEGVLNSRSFKTLTWQVSR